MSVLADGETERRDAEGVKASKFRSGECVCVSGDIFRVSGETGCGVLCDVIVGDERIED